jgi:hypothetical protein
LVDVHPVRDGGDRKKTSHAIRRQEQINCPILGVPFAETPAVKHQPRQRRHICMTSSLIEALPGPTGDPQMAPGQHTLARNSVKLPEVMFIAIATMAPGVGSAFSLPTGAPFAGSSLPGSVVVALFGCFFVSVAIAELAERIPSAGGMATYIGRAFHGGAGFLSGWAYALIYVLALGYLALLSGDLLG